MKKLLILLVLATCCTVLFSASVRHQPYILAGFEEGTADEAVAKVEGLLTENGFEIVGKYSPLKDENRVVVCTTHDLLKKAVDKIGGLTAFALVMRFGIYKNGDKVEISYMNPIYWGNAFFRKEFPEVETDFMVLDRKIAKMFRGLSYVKTEHYGSEDGGIKEKKLRKYHFGLFMPYFDDIVTLKKKTDHDEIVKKIDENLAKHVGDAVKVFKLSFPSKKCTLYGAGLFGEYGELRYWPKVEKTEHTYKHITALPFMFLVMEDKVVMLHGKYSVPLAFPDAGMGTFLKIMSAPGKTHDYMRDIVNK